MESEVGAVAFMKQCAVVASAEPLQSSASAAAERVGQAASAWCHDGGQTVAFTVVRGGPWMIAQAPDLRT